MKLFRSLPVQLLLAILAGVLLGLPLLLESRGVPMGNKLGVYIHIPFCKAKCDYCDFYSLPDREGVMDDYQKALMAHIKETAPLAKGWQVTYYTPFFPVCKSSFSLSLSPFQLPGHRLKKVSGGAVRAPVGGMSSWKATWGRERSPSGSEMMFR